MQSAGSTGSTSRSAAGAVTAWQNAIGASSRAATTRAAALTMAVIASCGIDRRPPLVHGSGQIRQRVQARQPAADARPGRRHGRIQPGECRHRRDGIVRPGQRRRTGQQLIPGGPQAKSPWPVRRPGRQKRRRRRCGQRPDRVRGPDHPVGGARGEPRQQPWPPPDQRVPPAGPGDLHLEERRPVPDVADVAEPGPPVTDVDPVPWRRLRGEPGPVPVHPAGDLVVGAELDDRFGGHRPVVGQEAVELRPGVPQPVEGVEQGVGHHGGHCRTTAAASQGADPTRRSSHRIVIKAA